jgi:hypothetical protein
MRKGRISHPSIKVVKKFTLDDLMYIDSYYITVKKTYDFLVLWHTWSKQISNYKNFTQLAKDHNMNSCISSVLKSLGYANNELKWQLKNLPTKGDAIIIQLAIRDYNRG